MKLISTLFASFALSSCYAGTYSLVELEVIGSTTSDGGFLQKLGDNITLRYGLTKSIQAGYMQSLSAYSVSQGYVRWKFEWERGEDDDKETYPEEISVKMATYGHAFTNATTFCDYFASGTYSASSNLLGYLAILSSSVASSNPYMGLSDPKGTQTNAHLGYIYLNATFTPTGPNTAVGYCLMTVNESASLSAVHQPSIPQGTASAAIVDTDHKWRPIEIDGQIVASDLP